MISLWYNNLIGEKGVIKRRKNGDKKSV